MKLILNNVGGIQKCELEFNGITVITGENSTGKSTIGKSLYLLWEAFNDIDRKSMDILIERASVPLLDFFKENRSLSLDEFSFYFEITETELFTSLVKEIFIDKELLMSSTEEISKFILRKIENSDLEYDFSHLKKTIEDYEEDFSKAIAEMLEMLKIDMKKIKIEVVEKMIQLEFRGDFRNKQSSIDEDVRLIAEVKKKEIGYIKSKDTTNILQEMNLLNKVIFIDDPYIVDNVNTIMPRSGLSSRYFSHKSKILGLLKISKIDDVDFSKIEDIDKMISKVIGGSVVNNRLRKYNFKQKDGVEIDISNTAAGAKSLIFLKFLLMKGVLKAKDILVLDEPEVHLHTTWQVKFAEIIVLLQEKLNLTVLINTHSPFFLYAISVFIKKYKRTDIAKFYQAYRDGSIIKFEDCQNDINYLYKKMNKAFDMLEEVEEELDE